MPPSDKKRLHVVNVRLDDETLAVLREMADAQHRPLANLIAAILKDYVGERDPKNK